MVDHINVVTFRAAAGAGDDRRPQPQQPRSSAPQPSAGDRASKRGSARVQVRLNLETRAETERDLQILADAVRRAQDLIRRSPRAEDGDVLGGVRVIMEKANRHLNPYRRAPR